MKLPWPMKSPPDDAADERELEGFLQALISHASGEINPQKVDADRMNLLQQATLALGEDQCAALLWQSDRNSAGTELRLAYAYDKKEQERRPAALRNIALPMMLPHFPALLNGVADTLESWFKSHHPDSDYSTFEIEVACRRDNGETRQLGFLQILGSADLAKRARESWKIRAIAAALGARITVDRQIRPMRAMQRLQEEIPLSSTDNVAAKVFQAAAKVLQETISAELCVVYRPSAQDSTESLKVLGFQAKNGEGQKKDLKCSTETLTYKAFRAKRIARIGDINNQKEVSAAFKGAKSDPTMLKKLSSFLEGPALSWMCAPVMVSALTTEDKEEQPVSSVALIKLINKTGTRYLHGGFTETDEHIAQMVANYLSKVIPGAEMSAALEDLSKAFAQAKFDNIDAITQALYNTLSPWVNGISAIAMRFGDAGAAHHYPNNLPGTVLAQSLPSARDRLFEPIKQSIKEQSIWFRRYSLRIGGEKTAGMMAVALRHHHLPHYQAEIIRRAAMEFARLAYDMSAYENALRQLIETRHAIRSGIQGMIGHIGSATADLNFLAENNNPEETHRELIIGASFRKALELAYLSAHQTSMLLEEARYAFAGDKQIPLTLGEHNLPALVKEACRIIRPEFEVRDIDLDLQIGVPPHLERAQFDRKMIVILINNILDNASKYAYRDTKVVVNLKADGKYWYLSVTDTGVYIAPEARRAIFEMFRRVAVHDPSARNGVSARPGTGLGLYICKQIVKAHSAEVDLDVSSEWISESEGRAETTFSITIPRRIQEQKND